MLDSLGLKVQCTGYSTVLHCTQKKELYLLSSLSIICFIFFVFQVGIKHLVVYLNKADAVDDEEVIELVI